MFPFDPNENIRKPLVFCFQGDQKGTLGRKGLTLCIYIYGRGKLMAVTLSNSFSGIFNFFRTRSCIERNVSPCVNYITKVSGDKTLKVNIKAHSEPCQTSKMIFVT